MKITINKLSLLTLVVLSISCSTPAQEFEIEITPVTPESFKELSTETPIPSETHTVTPTLTPEPTATSTETSVPTETLLPTVTSTPPINSVDFLSGFPIERHVNLVEGYLRCILEVEERLGVDDSPNLRDYLTFEELEEIVSNNRLALLSVDRQGWIYYRFIIEIDDPEDEEPRSFNNIGCVIEAHLEDSIKVLDVANWSNSIIEQFEELIQEEGGILYPEYVDHYIDQPSKEENPPAVDTEASTENNKQSLSESSINKISRGIHIVGEEGIKPGVYVGGANCYWERLSSSDGSFDSIIANGSSNGRFYVEVLSTDFAFETQCVLIPYDQVSAPDIPSTSVSSGMHIVGRDIATGIYIGDGKCYWEKLADFKGDFDSIIANDNTDGQFYVELFASDLAIALTCPIQLSSEVTPPPQPLVNIEPGMYMIGRDISPGIYVGNGKCYWERLRNLSGEFGGIIDNGNVDGEFLVEVYGSDIALFTNCTLSIEN